MSDQPKPIDEPVIDDSTSGSGAVELQPDLQTDPTPQYTDNSPTPAQQIVDQQIDGANPFTVKTGSDVKPVARQSQSGSSDSALMRESQPLSGVIAGTVVPPTATERRPEASGSGAVGPRSGIVPQLVAPPTEVPQDRPKPTSEPPTQVPTELQAPTELPPTARQLPQTTPLGSIITRVPTDEGAQTRQAGTPDMTRSTVAATLGVDGGVRVPVDKGVVVGGVQPSPEMSGAKSSLVGLTGVTTVGGMTNPAERGVSQNLASRMDTAQVMRTANDRILAEDSGKPVVMSPESKSAMVASLDTMARRVQASDLPEDLTRGFTTPKFADSSVVKSSVDTTRLINDANRLVAVSPDSMKSVSEGMRTISESTRVVASDSVKTAPDGIKFVSENTRFVTDSARSSFDVARLVSEGNKLVSDGTRLGSSDSTRFVSSDSTRLAADTTRLVTDAKGQVLMLMSPCTTPETKTREVLAATDLRPGSKEPSLLASNPYRLLETQSANDTRVRTAASLQLHGESGRAAILSTWFAADGGRINPIRPVERTDLVARALPQQPVAEFEPLSVRARSVVALEMAGTRSSATTGAAERFTTLKIDSKEMLDQALRSSRQLTLTGTAKLDASLAAAGPTQFVATIRRPGDTAVSGTTGSATIGNSALSNGTAGNGAIGNSTVGHGTLVSHAIVSGAVTKPSDSATTREPVTKDATAIPGLVSGDLCTCRNGQKCSLCLEASRTRLEQLTVDTSPENPTLNMLALELALIALVTVAAVAKENDRDLEEAERTQNDNKDEQSTPIHAARPTHVVKKGDTLDSIAEQHFGDRAVAFLIADLNKGRTKQTYADGKLIVEIYENTSIELPVWNELRKAYREGALNLSPKVLTIVLGNPLTSALNRQSLNQLAVVLGGGSIG
ncbi:MAG: hypothetical protein U0105_02420 [Candidatus Obscuribacterales bacterium]